MADRMRPPKVPDGLWPSYHRLGEVSGIMDGNAGLVFNCIEEFGLEGGGQPVQACFSVSKTLVWRGRFLTCAVKSGAIENAARESPCFAWLAGNGLPRLCESPEMSGEPTVSRDFPRYGGQMPAD